MRVPISWLKDYVQWEGSAEELADLLSMSGTEVENILSVGAPAGPENLDLFRVGRVVTKVRHPNADKLWLCTVDVRGDGDADQSALQQIVCGADNFAAGDTVAVALPGSVLENGLKLRKANLRGVESCGMMLSEQELGFEVESPGIVVLPAEWPVGDRLAEHLPVAEQVLELEITPNRPDCLSVYGVAREVAAAAGLPLAPPPVEEPPAGGDPASADIAAEVPAPDLCPRYGLRVIRDVTIAESPAWLKARLTHAGQRPISNVVDVTNYVMLAVGQPLHAFDLEKVPGRRLIVRRATAGERITTLDDVERTLDENMLVIADPESPSAIAGVMGSAKSEIDASTRHLALEAATFNGPNILRTSSQLGLRSEASTRFEKGLDQEYVPQGLAMASRLFHGLCGGTVAPGMVDVRAGAARPEPLRYRPARSDALLGVAVPLAEQAAILERIGCAVEAADGGGGPAASAPAGGDAAAAAVTSAPAGAPATDAGAGGGQTFTVTPPTFRADLEREVDLIEEVGRLHGLDKVPETLPLRRDAVGMLTPQQRLRRRARAALTGAGLDEVVTYAFIDAAWLELLGLPADDPRRSLVRLANPMSGEQAVMRTSVLPSLLATVRDNLAHQNYPVTVFEQARVYLSDSGTAAAGGATSGDSGAAAGGATSGDSGATAAGPRGINLPAVESEMLTLVLCGPLGREGWTGRPRSSDFYTLKGLVERLLTALRIEDADYRRSNEPFLHPGKAADLLLGGRSAGFLGQLRPDVVAGFGIEGEEVYAAELRIDALLEAAAGERVYEDLIAFPTSTQDLAVVLDAGVAADDLLAAVTKAGGKLLRSAAVFDVYEGDQVPPGKRSLAVRLVIRAADRTLTEKDIGGVRQKVVAALERELGAALR